MRTIIRCGPSIGIAAALAISVVACSSDQGDSGAARDNDPSSEGDIAKSASALRGNAAQALSAAQTRLPGLRAGVSAGKVSRLFGTVIATGQSAEAAAKSVVSQFAPVLQVNQADLAPGVASGKGAVTVPVLYDKATGKYRFSLVRQHQSRGGVPVFRTRLDTLVGRSSSNPAVAVTAQTRPLGGFVPKLRGQALISAPSGAEQEQLAETLAWRDAASKALGIPLTSFSKPTLTIWAGAKEQDEAPKMALQFVADNYDAVGTSGVPARWLFVVDAENGDILYRENMILDVDVEGSVSATTLLGSRASECDEIVIEAMQSASVSIEAGSAAYTDGSGQFQLPNTGTEPVTVNSPMAGEFFVIYDNSAMEPELLFQQLTPPGPGSFLHNADNQGEELLAQTNAYIHATEIRNWVLSISPDFPVVSTQTGFPVYVNDSTGACPGNAWYDYSSLHSCLSGGGYTNTSFASVTHHEYGHHLVSSAGSGQGAYGEGMADTLAMLVADDPGLGYGFYQDQCDSPLRTADNDCQYLASGCSTCGSESHACGNLLSGAVYSALQELRAVDPDNALDIISTLAVNSILLHAGTSITSQIATDFLTLDDNDGNLANGTPHYAQLCAGFEAHGLQCPELQVGLSVVPNTVFETIGNAGGPFVPESRTYTLENLGPDPIDYSVSVDTQWLDVSNASGSLLVGETAAVEVSINTLANELPNGHYSGHITFDNLGGTEGDIALPVDLGVGVPTVVYSWPLDTDPGWSTEGGWEFGVPLGASYDPSTAHSGNNVFGYVLAGSYPNNLGQMHLTTNAIDCSDLTQVSARFWRWLSIESSVYDHASFSVSTDGTAFTEVWAHNGSALIDSAWSLQSFDIASIADGQPAVYLRWTMGTTDSSVVYGGWNIDDIQILGVEQDIPPCTSDAECDDQLFCNGTELCVGGTCLAGEPLICDDSIACTDDSCDEATDSCANAVDDAWCNDGLFCNGAEVCTQTGCQPGQAVVCDDTVGCTADSCNESTDSCTAVPDDTLCDNGVFCDGAEHCDATNGCMMSPLPCGNGECDEATQECLDCEASVFEGETMVHSTGGSVADGWNIWSNGYASTTASFDPGSLAITVVARGSYAGGAWPHMLVRIGGTVIYETVVDSDTWQQYAFVYESSGMSEELRVEFDNDYYSAPDDRNLYLDKVIIGCTVGGTVCGDGTVDSGEACDDGNTEDGDGCSWDCRLEANCDDGILNGSETGVDCGGADCQACPNGDPCLKNTDCQSQACVDGICGPPLLSCDDGILNGSETGVDCGGADCQACPNGDPCLQNTDCQSQACVDGICDAGEEESLSGAVDISNDWGAGYCATLEISNPTATATSSWNAAVDTMGATIYSSWNGTFTGTTGMVSITHVGWNSVIAAGGIDRSVGFCANRPAGSTALPVFVGVSGTF